MMWWFLERIEQQTGRLRGMVCCVRCGMYFRKELERCSNCTGLSDDELSRLLAEKKNFKLSLGTMMLFGAILLFVAMLFAVVVFD